MLFVLSKVFWIVAAPANLALIILMLGLLLLWVNWIRAGRFLTSIGGVALVFLAVIPLGPWLAWPLENRFPQFEAGAAAVDGIIVLGGSTNPRMTELRGQISVNGAVERLIVFAKLARAYPDAKLVFTGGSGSLSPGALSEADVAEEILIIMGGDMGRIRFEREARNTFESGRNAKALAIPSPSENWLLVTSAMHMPRAMGVFRKAGWPVTAYPVDFATGRAPPRLGLRFNLAGNGRSTQIAIREWVGLAAYKAFGRTDSFFPAPEDRRR
jgi:uncharacterized SAM-binding protein YcdF (DUF218 family)